MGVHPKVGSDKVKDVAAIAGGSIRPEAGFLAFKNKLQTVTRASQNIASQELALPLLASGKHREEHGLQPCNQVGPDLITLRLAIDVRRYGGVVEVNHSDSPAPCSPRSRTAELCIAQLDSSDSRYRTSPPIR